MSSDKSKFGGEGRLRIPHIFPLLTCAPVLMLSVSPADPTDPRRIPPINSLAIPELKGPPDSRLRNALLPLAKGQGVKVRARDTPAAHAYCKCCHIRGKREGTREEDEKPRHESSEEDEREEEEEEEN